MPREVPMDLLNDSTEEVVYKRKNGNLFEKIVDETSFNEREVKSLCLIHRKIEKVRGPLSRSVLRDIFHSGFDFTENKRHILIDRIFSQFDKRNALQVSTDNWVAGISTIFREPLQEKTNFAYKVYDLMRVNKISKEQIFPMLRGCLIKLIPEEDLDEAEKDMIEMLVKAIDIDRDGDINPSEFRETVLDKNQLFLECMGPVLPSREARHAFLTTFADAPQF